MNRPPLVVVIPKRSIPEAPKAHPAENRNHTPREKPNPLAVASLWLRGRLEERPAGYFLDGTPADLHRIMRETNRVLVSHGEEMLTANPRWLP